MTASTHCTSQHQQRRNVARSSAYTAPLIVTGMHGSASDHVANEVAASPCGIFLAPTSGVDLGEMDCLLEFHQDVLWRDVGHDCWVTQLPSPNSDDAKRAEQLLKRAASRGPWGWTDHRAAMFLDFWDRLAPEAKYLFVVDRPEQVVHRLCRQYGIHSLNRWWHGRLLECWTFHVQTCVRFLSQHPQRSLLVFLEDVLRQRRLYDGRLSEFLGASAELPSEADRQLSRVAGGRRLVLGHVFPRATLRQAKQLYRLMRRQFPIGQN